MARHKWKTPTSTNGFPDFDFGEARLNELSSKTNFPWLLSNVFHEDPGTSEQHLLSQARESFVLKHGIHRIGFFGLAGTDWPSGCQNLPPCKISSPTDEARRVAQHLRTVDQCDFVIAVTHMRLADDLLVSDATNGGDELVDLLLGGHDHDVVQRSAGSRCADPARISEGYSNEEMTKQGQVRPCHHMTKVIKSGTNWRGLSVVRLRPTHDNDRVSIGAMTLHQFTDLRDSPQFQAMQPDPDIQRVLTEVHEKIHEAAQHPLLHCLTPLDGRSGVVRSSETNLGNMIADAVRAYYEVEIALVNSGGIRCDMIMEPTLETLGAFCRTPLTVKDIISIVPFDNAFVVKKVRGQVLLAALENSLSDAHTDGRFLQLSGLRIEADWRRQEGRRLLRAWHMPSDCPSKEQLVDPDMTYTVAMVAFLGQGFDGYVDFPSQETLVGEEGAMTDTRLMLNIFGHDMTSATTYGLPKDEESSIAEDDNDGIRRARNAIVKGYAEDGLPFVAPNCEGRIIFKSTPN